MTTATIVTLLIGLFLTIGGTTGAGAARYRAKRECLSRALAEGLSGDKADLVCGKTRRGKTPYRAPKQDEFDWDV